MTNVIGNVRVTALSPTLVRLEQKGPRGFEDRETFTVVDRTGQGPQAKIESLDGDTLLVYPEFRVLLKGKGESLVGAQVQTPRGRKLYEYVDGKFPAPEFFPGPGEKIDRYVVADHPRIVPPAWGATPAPKDNTQFPETSGWDVGNDAPDIYVFVPGKAGYKALRADFLKLTGHSPMLPLWSFGLWDSRYYVYKQQEALDTIDTYRKHDFPLDGFVVDTDWRVNGSDGYQVETKLFPDMAAFLKQAHEKNVRVMFNDHPSPIDDALSPKELDFRWKGLNYFFKIGLDTWWYDRNWHTHLREPAPGIQAEIWGQRVFHDMTLRAKPNLRPMAMSNFQGIDNGKRNYAPHPAGHRFPMMWTGDTQAHFNYLRFGIANGVDMGLLALHPYVNEDLGGHAGTPSSELYVRFLQYGVFGPITRVHCTLGQDRHPWAFGSEAEAIVRDYVKMRYRLLPTLYAASRQSFEDGTPILRRCDLEWPAYKEATDNQQFLFGDDLLVAPMNDGVDAGTTVIPSDFLKTEDGRPGFTGQYFLGRELQGKPVFERVDPIVKFDWSEKPPQPKFPMEDYSVRWTGVLGPMPVSGEYTLATETDDGTRLYVDGKLVLEHWFGMPTTEYGVKVKFEKGSTHHIVFEYFQAGGGAEATLKWALPNQEKKVATRNLWIPPGTWVDAWTGAELQGPKTIEVECPIWHTPMYLRSGGLVLLAPEAQYATEKPWDALTAEAFLPEKDSVVERTLYEDDGETNAYLKGSYRKTQLRWERVGVKARLTIQPGEGAWRGGVKERGWTLRIHVPHGLKLSGPGLTAQPSLVTGQENAMPLAGAGAKGRLHETVYEVEIPKQSLRKKVSLELHIGRA